MIHQGLVVNVNTDLIYTAICILLLDYEAVIREANQANDILLESLHGNLFREDLMVDCLIEGSAVFAVSYNS